MKLISFFSITLFAILFVGCEKNNLSSGDLQPEIPLLSNPTVAPDSIYLDNLTPSGGVYSVGTVVKVKMKFPGSNQTVVAKVLRPTTSDLVTSTTLHDDGITPDQVANDSVYSGQIQFTVQRALAGRYRIQIVAQTPEGYQSNILEKSFKLARRNSVPSLSSLNAPDSVSVAFGGSITVQMTIAASDSDGLADIRQVYFRSLASQDTVTRFLMKDDGGRDEPQFPSFPRSGDASSGDGIYSIQIPLSITDTTQYRLNVFAFKAEDVFGDTSTTLVHNFRVRRP